MKVYRIGVLLAVGLLLLSSMQIALSEGKDSDLWIVPSSRLELYSVDTGEYISFLRKTYGLPISFICVPFEKNKMITASEEIARLKNQLGSHPMSRDQFSLVEAWSKLAANGNEPINFKTHKFNVEIDIKSIQDVLGSIVAADPDYEVLINNTRIIVLPKSDEILNWRFSFHAGKGQSLLDVWQSLGETFKSHGIFLMKSAGESGGDAYTGVLNTDVNLDNVTAMDALARLCEAVGPDVVWQMTGFKTVRYLSLIRIPKDDGVKMVQ